MDRLNWFDEIYIHKESEASEIGQRVLNSSPKSPVFIVDDSFLKKGPLRSPEDVSKSKKRLYLKPFKGSFFKRCPGAKPKLLCCNYYVLNLGQHCEMDCSYCYLQSFINFPAVVIYTNTDQALFELSELKREYQDRYIRIGTGEQTDSLSLDDISRNAEKLVSFFRDCPNWLLEFKTKSHNVKNFEDTPHNGNVVVSWSLNPEEIVKQEEHGTSSLEERLQTARRVKDKGFRVSFHIDPVIYHPDWMQNYKALADRIISAFQPEEVTHLSFGALRFPPSQKALMRERFGMTGSYIPQGEFFKGADGKLRYDNALRQELFRFLWNQFKKRNPLWNAFLCMETPENWLYVAGNYPSRDASLRKDFRLFREKSFKKAYF